MARRRPALRRVKLVVRVFIRDAVRIGTQIARRTNRIGIGRWWWIAQRWRLRRRILCRGTADRARKCKPDHKNADAGTQYTPPTVLIRTYAGSIWRYEGTATRNESEMTRGESDA